MTNYVYVVERKSERDSDETEWVPCRNESDLIVVLDHGVSKGREVYRVYRLEEVPRTKWPHGNEFVG